MIKAIIFDLNGIFIQSQKFSERFERDYDIPAAQFLPELTTIMAQIRKPGAKSAYHYWKPVMEGWGIHFTETALWDYWFHDEKVSKSMVRFAQELRSRGIKVIILSNNFKERAEYYGHYAWIHTAVDKIYFSWATGYVKPDPAAWRYVLSDNKLKPEECLYFDDQAKNIKAAESVGIQSYMFTDEEELKKIVNENCR